jgi:hypothetical protein
VPVTVESKAAVGACWLTAILVGTGIARADEFQLHGNVGALHAVGDPQQSQYGFGVGGAIAGELTFAKIIGLQAELSGLALTTGEQPEGRRIAHHGAGLDVEPWRA